MAQNIGLSHGLPNMGALKSPGRYSPTENSHPKQLQHHYPSCTTQAPPPAMTDDKAGALSGCRTPDSTPSPRRAETFVPEDNLHASRSPVLAPGSPQHGSAVASQQGLMRQSQVHDHDHYSDDLQHRIKDMWPSRPSKSDVCDQAYDTLKRERVSETASGRCSSQLPPSSQEDNDYEKLGSHPRDWMGNPQNLFQQPFIWNQLSPTTQTLLHPAQYFQNRLELAHQGHSVNTSASYDPSMGNMDRSFDDVHPNYLNAVPTTTSFPCYTANRETAIASLSPAGADLSFYKAQSAMRQDREGTVPFSEADIDSEYRDDALWQDQLLDGSPSSMEASGSKVDEPYAQLIYRAFMSRPNKSMTLQEIYQWFRENTEKSKAEGKGWQNSIRHNLSMNGAFTKRNSKTPLSGNGDGSLSLDNSGIDGRKSTEWLLEPAFYSGVESTTRYRKGNSGSRSRGASGHPGKSRLGSDGHGSAGGGFSHARVSAGRKGGNVAAQNRKRQQHARQMEMARVHPRHLQHQGFTGPISMPYGGFEEGVYYPHYPAPHLAPSPFPPGFGEVPAAIERGQGVRQSDIVYNCFDSDDVNRDMHIKRSRGLGTDNDHHNDNEPVTPPGSSLDPPQSAHFASKHREFLPGITGSYNPLNSYQVGVDHDQQQQQLQNYSSASVTGVYDPPDGGHQPSLFVDEDISLFPDDALLMNLDFGG